MTNYKLPTNVGKWDFENGFYLTCENSRISDFISHCEIYKMILGLPGDVAEFGVYKGSSFISFLSFREYFEHSESRKFFGFDVFGKFPDNLELESDRALAKTFEDVGDGISKEDLDQYLSQKNIQNYELIEGDILKTLPNFIKNNPERRFSLIHVDVDVYEPTPCILEHLWDRTVRGGIIVFDDYGIIEGETKAVDEFLKSKKDLMLRKLPYKYKPSYIIK